MDKKRRTELTMEESFELGLGPGGFGSAFATEAVRKEAWEAHREQLLAERLVDGVTGRPWAWWRYEAAEPRNYAEHETHQLLRLGVVSAAERAVLERQWAPFERVARDMAVLYADRGGAAAYWSHRRAHGIPDDWSAPDQPASMYEDTWR